MLGKIIIFDLDGTFYDLSDVHLSNFQVEVEFLSLKKNLSMDESISLLERNHIYPEIRLDSKSATEFFLQIGLDKLEWSEFRDLRFDVNKIDLSKAVREEVIKAFSKYGCIVLLSSNAFNIIERILKYLSVTPDDFDEIICSDRYPYNSPFKKKKAMEYLSSKYQVAYDCIYSIGDRFSTDIKPVLELGGKGVLIQSPLGLSKLLRDFENGTVETNNEYVYYQ